MHKAHNNVPLFLCILFEYSSILFTAIDLYFFIENLPRKNSCFILLLLSKFPYYFFPIPKERFFLYKKCRMPCMRHFYTASILFYIPLQRFHSGLHIVNFTKLHSFFHCFNRKNLQLFLDLIRDVPKIVFVCLRNQNSLYPGAFRRH